MTDPQSRLRAVLAAAIPTSTTWWGRVSERLGACIVAALLVVTQSCSINAPSPTARNSMTATTHVPAWLAGVWSREWIERAGARTSSFDVHYFQTASAFADFRIPRERAELAHSRSFADLTDRELLLLARQRGFAGTTTVAGDLATWHHEIDFQPPDSSPDIGRLERVNDLHMLEHALDSSYVESWRSTGSGDGRFLALRLEREGRLERALVIVGDHFLYVRNRQRDLPPAESLDSLIVSTRATRAQIIAYLDCEFSMGVIGKGSAGWEIQRSTLPWREGRRLELVDELALRDGLLTLLAPASDGVVFSVPVNTFSKGELEGMFVRRQ
jgi:hypothetical protein